MDDFVACLSLLLLEDWRESRENEVKSTEWSTEDDWGGMQRASFLIRSAVIFFNSLAEASISTTSSVGHPDGAKPEDLMLITNYIINIPSKSA